MSISIEQALGEQPIPDTPEPVVEDVAEAQAETEGVKEPDSPPESEPTHVPLAALTGERSKRQETERKLAELEKRLAEKEAVKPPSVFEDEEGAFKAVESKLSQEFTNQLLHEGEAEAVSKHGEDTVQAAVAWVLDAAKTSPFIAQQLANTPLLQQHRKAVTLYQQEQSRAELADPDAMRAKLKEEVKAELLAEQEAKQKETEKLRASIPKSLVGDTSKGSLKGSDWSGPTPLESVIGSGA